MRAAFYNIRRFRYLVAAVAVCGFGGYVAWRLLGTQDYIGTRDVYVYTALLGSAIASMVVFAVQHHDDRVPWLLFATGSTVWLAADVLYSYGLLAGNETALVIADWGYLGFYPFAYVAVILLLYRRLHRPTLAVWLDAGIVALAVGAYVGLVLGQSLTRSGATTSDALLTVASLIGDIAFLCLLIGIIGIIGWRADRMWLLLLGGAIIMWAADSAWMLADWAAATTHIPGPRQGIAWTAVFLLFGAAPWQSRRRTPPKPRLFVTVGPVIGTIFALAMVLFATQRPIEFASVAAASAALILGSIRILQALRSESVHAEVQRQARTDELTGLANLRTLNATLTALSPRTEAILILVDLNDFKEVNDSLGHSAGDTLLRTVADRITPILTRDDDVAVRVGGDEFAVLLFGGGGEARGIATARTLRAAIEQPVTIEQVEFHVQASVGVALWPDHASTREDIMRAADTAMYRSKRDHIGQYLYTPGEDIADRGRLLLLQDLRRAINHDEFICHYQPQLDLTSGVVNSVEALVRWQRPDGTLAYPDTFLALMEDTGLIRPLTSQLINVVLHQNAEWARRGYPLTTSINLSMSNLWDPDLPTVTAATLDATGVPPERVIFEVTETVIMRNLPRVRNVTAALRDLGITVSVDDYGTEHSSLANLRELVAAELKLDRSFVTGLSDNSTRHAIFASTVTLAHDLGVRMVAEGVETKADLDTVAALGCDIAQGYYISRPMPAEQVVDWLENFPHDRKVTPIGAV